jgi:predicted secreted protein
VERLGVSVLVALVYAASASAATAPLVLTARANGTTVHVHSGRAILLELSANPSTGYAWLFRGRLPAQLRVVKTRYIEPPRKPGPPKVGLPVVFEVQLRAVKPGTAKVKLGYRRREIPLPPPAKTFTVTVVVAT